MVPAHRQGKGVGGQQLAQTVALRTSIDTTIVTGNTKWVQPETFPEDIAPFPGDKEKEAEKAKRHTDSLGLLSLWTDGSQLESEHTGAIVA